MPVRAQALTMHFFASDSDGPKTGETYSSTTLKIIKDGTVSSVAGTLSEVDATNAPGIYKVAITAAENTADVCTLCGKSSTSGVTISPSTWTNITNADANVAAIKTAVDAILVDTGTAGVVLANDAITAAKIADDAIGADQLKADAVTEIATAIAAKALTAASSVPGSTPTIDQALMWLYQRFRYKVTQTSTQQKMHESDNSTLLGTSTISDDGTTVTQGGFS